MSVAAKAVHVSATKSSTPHSVSSLPPKELDLYVTRHTSSIASARKFPNTVNDSYAVTQKFTDEWKEQIRLRATETEKALARSVTAALTVSDRMNHDRDAKVFQCLLTE